MTRRGGAAEARRAHNPEVPGSIPCPTTKAARKLVASQRFEVTWKRASGGIHSVIGRYLGAKANHRGEWMHVFEVDGWSATLAIGDGNLRDVEAIAS